MKFILIVGAVALAAGGATYALTGQPEGAKSNPLAGDWYCDYAGPGQSGAIQMAIDANGFSRAEAHVGERQNGREISMRVNYDSKMRVEGGDLFETADNYESKQVLLDGREPPREVVDIAKKLLETGEARYRIVEFEGIRLVYDDLGNRRTSCTRVTGGLP